MTCSVELTDQQWRARLTGEHYGILRQAGTERAFTGAYWDSKDTGTYRCAACHTPLFSSDTKYDSRTGWPSFWDAVEPSRVERREDRSHGWCAPRSSARPAVATWGTSFRTAPGPPASATASTPRP
jgi:peptide-methionine (R)-S-oxide reductase